MELEEKLEIMREFIEQTGQEINPNTVYKTYKLGAWKKYIRALDKKGKLKISKELRKQYEKMGILCRKRRRIKKSDFQKFEYIVNYQNGTMEQNDKNTQDIQAYKHYLQTRYNRKQIALTSEQIRYLKQTGILNYSAEEKEEDLERRTQLAQRLGISLEDIKYINDNFGTVEEFVKKYKSWDETLNTKLKIYVHKRAIAISSREISAEEKDRYLKLVSRILGKEYFEQLEYINIDKIDEILATLTEKEQYLVNSYYGLNGEKRKTFEEIGKEENATKETIRQRIYTLLQRKRQIFLHNGMIGNYEEDINNRNAILSGKTSDEIIYSNFSIEELNLSTRSFHYLSISGIVTIEDLMNINVRKLYQIRNLGRKSINEITSKLEQFKKKIAFARDEQFLNLSIVQLDERITAYERAYQDFLNLENIFNPNEIIPESIGCQNPIELQTDFENTTTSILQERKNARQAKSEDLENLDEEIREQERKETLLERILEENGINPSSKGVNGNNQK